MTFGRVDPLWAILAHPDKVGNRWDVEEFFETGRKEVAAIISRLHDLGITISGGKALDFGCGVGRLSQALCAHCDEMIGVDIAPSMIEKAKALNQHRDKCQYLVNTDGHLAVFPASAFDVVFSCIVLQHLQPEDSKEYIREFFRISRNSAVIAFQIPSHPLGCTRVMGPLPADACKAGIEVRGLPKEVEIGASVKISVSVRNQSSVAWPALAFEGPDKYLLHVGNHWLDASGMMVLRDDGRSSLQRDLLPGKEDTIDLIITSPQDPGEYQLEVDMVQEGVRWFHDGGGATWRSEVRVARSLGGGSGRASKDTDDSFDRSMWMCGVPQAEVISLIEDEGGTLLSVDVDEPAPGWVGYRYYAQKH